MADNPKFQPQENIEPVEAGSLHRHSLDVQRQIALDKLHENDRKRELASAEEKAAFQSFMTHRFDEQDFHRIQRQTGHAVHLGKMEAEIYRFPAKFLPDRGRAINNAEPDWPNSLCGYAASLYDVYMRVGKPQGFRLEARILDYPDGYIGMIAFYLCW